ncbi:MAG: sporulation protein [Lewinella sp.]|nr:sporulation protein [Lewinella sp.]
MIGKVKKWLGIEGVKLEIQLPEELELDGRPVEGQLVFSSMNPQTVTHIRLVLIERYSRGRGDEKLVDEYELGRQEIKATFSVGPDELVVRTFRLPYQLLRSEVDEWGARNPFNAQVAKAARWMRAAQSTYRIEAEAQVQGVALNPFDKKIIGQ